MADWEKREITADNEAELEEAIAVAPPAPQEEAQPDTASPEVRRSPRYTASGRRRGRRRSAAPIGFVVLILALVGVITLVSTGINAFIRSRDNSELIVEITTFLKPVIRQQPKAFIEINDTNQDQLLRAALWYLTNKERIRMDQQLTTISKYALDDYERWKIPLDEVEESYERLFGPAAPLTHHSIDEPSSTFSVEFNMDEMIYYAPLSTPMLLYEAVPDTLKKKGDTYILRICYVLTTEIGIDNEGVIIPPTPDMAEFAQLYTVQKWGDGQWMLVSIEDEGASAGTATAQPSDPETIPENTGSSDGTGTSGAPVDSNSK